MNREEAIQILSTRDAHGVLCGYTSGVTEALDMAIEALTVTVSREEYEELYRKAKEVNEMANDILADFPSYKEFVSVVRCKDCRWWQDNNGGYPHANCHWCETETPDADDFCSLGERREPSAEQTEYKLPGHDEVMEALDKLTLRGDDND